MAKKKKEVPALKQAAYDYINSPITKAEADSAGNYMRTINEGRKNTAPVEHTASTPDFGGRGYNRATQGAVDSGAINYQDVRDYFKSRKRGSTSNQLNGIGRRREGIDANGNYITWYERNNAQTNAMNVRPEIGGAYAGSWQDYDKGVKNRDRIPDFSSGPKQTQESAHTAKVEEKGKTTYWDLRDPDNPKTTSKEQYEQIRLLDADVAPESFGTLKRLEMTAGGSIENLGVGFERFKYEADPQAKGAAYRRVDELNGAAVPNEEWMKYHDEVGNVTDQAGWDKYLNKRRAEDRKKSKEIAAEQERVNTKLEAAKIGAGELGEFGLDMLGTGVQMVPGIAGSMAIGAVAPGAAFMGFATPMYAQVYGNEYNNAILDGASEDEAAQVAALNATVEVMSEALFAAGPTMARLTGVKRGIIPAMTKQEAKEYTMGLLKTTAGQDIKTGLSMILKSGSEEGIEEIVAGILQPAVNNLSYGDEKMDWKSTFKEALYNGLVGAAMGGMGGVVDVGKATKRGADIKRENQNNMVKDMVDYGLSMPEDRKVYQLARRVNENRVTDEDGKVSFDTAGRADIGYLERAMREEQQAQQEKAAEAYRQDTKTIKGAGLELKSVPEEYAYFRNQALNKSEDVTQETKDLFKDSGNTYGETYEKALKLASKKLQGDPTGEQRAEMIARSVARLASGEGYADFNSFSRIDSVAREVFEEATEQTLPESNAETAEFLRNFNYDNAYATTKADNERESTEIERSLALSLDIESSNTLGPGTAADRARKAILKDIPLADRPLAGEVFNRLYDYGRASENKSDFDPERFQGGMFDVLTEAQKRIAFEKGVEARQQAQQEAKEKAKNVRESKKAGKTKKVGYADTSKLSKDIIKDKKKSKIISLGRKIARRTRTIIVFETDETIAERYGPGFDTNGWRENGEIHINLDAADPLLFTFAHEFTHQIAELASEEYLELQDFIIQSRFNGDRNAWTREIDNKMREYSKSEQSRLKNRDEAIEEIIADMAAQFLNDEQTIMDLFAYDETLAEKIKDVVTKIVNMFLDYIKEIDAAGIETDLSEEQLIKARELWLSGAKVAKANGSVDVQQLADVGVAVSEDGEDVQWSLRKEAPPKKTEKGYKVFFVRDGKLYPPMVANPGGEATPTGVWLNADEGTRTSDSKTGRPQVKAGGKGTQGTSGSLAYRPGWHLGNLPIAAQFNRLNPKTGNKELFPAQFVWAECEIAADVDYQEEAMSYGYTGNGKFRHAYAGLPKVPTDGYYRYRTNPNPNTEEWMITGAMKVNRLLSDEEVNQILKENGREPIQRQGGNKTLKELGLEQVGESDIRFSLPDTDSQGKVLTPGQREYFKNSKAVDQNGHLAVVYHSTDNGGFTVFDPSASDDGRSLFFTGNRTMSEGYASRTGDIDPDELGGIHDARFPLDSVEEALELLDLYQENIYASIRYDGKWYSTYEDWLEPSELSVKDLKDRSGTITYFGVFDTDTGQLLSEGEDVQFNDIPGIVNDGIVEYNEYKESNPTSPTGKIGTYSVYLNLENPLVIDATGSSWDEITDPGFVFAGLRMDPNGEEYWVATNTGEEHTPLTLDEIRDRFGNGIADQLVDPEYEPFSNPETLHELNVLFLTGLERFGLDGNVTIELAPKSGGEGYWRVYHSFGQLGYCLYHSPDFHLQEYSEIYVSVDLRPSADQNGDTVEFNTTIPIDGKATNDIVDEIINGVGEFLEENIRPEYSRQWYWSYDDRPYDPEEEGYVESGDTRYWCERAYDDGYDGVIFRNLYDNGGYAYLPEQGDVYVAFNSNQVKDIRNENPTDNPDIRFSMDSKGRTLTDGQIEFFKDTKALDKDGNLAVVYHSTDKGGFTIFDPWFSDDKLSLFFTDDWAMSRSYIRNPERNDTLNPYDFVDMKSDIGNVKTFEDVIWFLDKYKGQCQMEMFVYDTNEHYSSNPDIYPKRVDDDGEPVQHIEDYYRNPKNKDKTIDRIEIFDGDLGLLESADNIKQGDVADILKNVLDDYGFKNANNSRGLSGTYAVYLNLKNPLIVDNTDGKHWSKIPYSRMSHDEAIDDLKGRASLAISTIRSGEIIGDGGYGTGVYSILVKGERKDAKGAWKPFTIEKTYPMETIDQSSAKSFVKDVLEEEVGTSSALSEFYDSAWTIRNYRTGEGRYYFQETLDDEKAYFDENGRYVEISKEYTPFASYTTREIAKIAKGDGYDGVIFRNIKDNGNRWTKSTGDVYVAFNSNQVKDVNNLNPTSDSDIRFSFAGENALNANNMMLQIAKTWDQEGRSSEEIRQFTGWHKGYDGKWRFEIDDSQAVLDTDIKHWKKYSKVSAPLDEFLQHDALFANYPQLRNFRLMYKAGGKTQYKSGRVKKQYGEFSPYTNTLTIRGVSFEDGNAKSTILHEIQHAIQTIEGHANGANPSAMKGRGASQAIEFKMYEARRALTNRIHEKSDTYNVPFIFSKTDRELDEIIPGVAMRAIRENDYKTLEAINNYTAALDRYNRADSNRPFKQYQRVAGEIEARDTESRMTMSEEQRRTFRPDIDRTDVLDENGNPITPKFSLVTPQEDRDYMDAVRSLPSEDDFFAYQAALRNLQKVVDNAAASAGYTIKAYHGTDSEPFNVFNRDYIAHGRQYGDGFYFSPLQEIAEQYQRYDLPKEYYLKANGVDLWSGDRTAATDYRDFNNAKDAEAFYDSKYNQFKQNGQGIERFRPTVEKLGNGAYRVNYTTIGAFENGLILVATEPEYIKSADPITYDDAGNVIPLSKRFDESNSDTRFSLNEDNNGRKLSQGQAEFFRNVSPYLLDEQGRLKTYYHGTARADRVGTVFLPERATSGPMAFFTDDKEMAERYSRDKNDTSLEYDGEDIHDYHNQFKAIVDGDEIPLERYWYMLSLSERERISKAAGEVTWDEDMEDFIRKPGNEHGNGGYKADPYLVRQGRDNAFSHLIHAWLDSGDLFNEEERFLNVLKQAGVNTENIVYKDPYYREEKVYEVYLNITNPFVTSDLDQEFIDNLYDWLDATDLESNKTESLDTDPWDKNNWDPYKWAEYLQDDLNNGTTYAWTSIPDVVTDFLKTYGDGYKPYDGIVDLGGKFSGISHQVVIPFDSSQVKDVTNENPTNDPDIRYSLNAIGMTEKNGVASWTPERINSIIQMDGGDNGYARSWAVRMDPRDFLKLTLPDNSLNKWTEATRNVPEEVQGMPYRDAVNRVWDIAKTTGDWIHDNQNYPLDENELRQQEQTPYLEIRSDRGFRVRGHEGRHRMRALAESGITSVPVLIVDSDTDFDKVPIRSLTLTSQDFGDGPVNGNASVVVDDLVPVNKEYRSDLEEKFGARDEDQIRFSLVTPQEDRDYLAAVNQGDMETAQRMVDAAARKAGYDTKRKLYHGTSARFNSFRASSGQYGEGVYFTYSKNIAEMYGGRVVSVYSKPLNTADYNELAEVLGIQDLESYWNGVQFPEDDITELGFHPESIDALVAAGYDSFVDEGNAGLVIFDSYDKVKSADPVTYDDQGNVIPLSKRFNYRNADIRFQLKSDAERERQELIARVNRLKRDKRLTHGREPKANQVAKFVRQIKKDHSSDYSLNQGIDSVTEIYKMIKSGDDFAEIYGAVQDLARSIADASFVMRDVEINHEAVDLRSYFKTGNSGKPLVIRVDEQDLAEFDKVGGIKEFRKKIRGVARITTTEGMDADVVMGEIVDMFGEQWDYYEQSKGSYMDALIDALSLATSEEATREPQEKVYRSDDRDTEEMMYVDPDEWDDLGVMSEIRADEVNMIIGEIFDAVELTIDPDLTFADRKKAEKERAIRRLKEDKQKALQILRETKNAQIKELKKEKSAAVRDIRALERERANRMLKLQRERQKQKERNSRTRKRKTQSIHSIERTANRLSRKLLQPSDALHIPERYRKAIATALASLDFESTRTDKWIEKFGHPSKRIAYFRDLKDEYKKIMDKDDGTLEMDDDIYTMIEELSERADGLRLADMTPEQVETVRVLMHAIEWQVNHANKMMVEGFKETRAATARQLADEIMAQKGETLSDTAFKNFVKADSTPVHFFDRLGLDTFKKMYVELTKAQDEHIRHMDEAIKRIEEITNRAGAKNIKKWSTIPKKHTLADGTTVEMTDAQVMSLYALSKREQARGHILGSGIVIKPLKVKRTTKGKVTERKASKLTRTKVKLTYGDVLNLVSTLSDAQMAAADEMLSYMRTAAEWGNETSMRLYGYRKFTEKNYFPIQSAQEFVQGSSIDENKKSPKMWNAGFTKAVQVGANNPLVLDDFFDVATAHINQMSQYNTFVPILQDMDRVYNYIQRGEDNDTAWSVQQLIREKHGTEAAKYIEQLMEDISGNLRRETNDLAVLDTLLRNWKAAKIGLSFRVLMQQPTAVVRALYEIDPKYFAGKPISKKARQRMWDIAPIALWKHWGYSQTDIHRSMRDTMMGNKGLKDQLFFDMYGKADDIGWTAIFMAVERETRDLHPELKYDSPEYRAHVNQRFREIVDRTQVVDSVLHRSQLMRSQSTMTKAFTAFMAEPTVTVNTVVSGMTKALEAKRAGNKKEAAKYMTRTGTVFFMNAVAVSLAASLASTIRETFRGDDDDDDEEQNWIDGVLERAGFEEGSFMRDWLSGYFVDEFKDNINFFNMIPVTKDVVSKLKGFESPNPTISLVYDTIDTGKQLFEWMRDPDDKKYSGAYYIERTIEKAAELFGVPASNIRKEVDGITNMYFRAISEKEYGDYLEDRFWLNDEYSKNKNVFIDHYVNAKIQGHEQSADDILDKLHGAGITEEEIEKRAWKVAAPDFKESVIAGRNTDTEEANLIALGLTQEEIDEKKAGYLKDAVKEAAKDRDATKMKGYQNRLMNEYGYGQYDVDKLVKSAALGEAFDLIDEGNYTAADGYITYIVNNADYTHDDIEKSILNHYAGDYYDAIDSRNLSEQRRLRNTLNRYGVTNEELYEKEANHYKDYYRQKAYMAWARGDRATAYQIAQQYASKYPGTYKKGAAGMIYGLDNLSEETVKKYRSSSKYTNWQIP